VSALFVDEPWPEPEQEISIHRLPDHARFERANVYELRLDAPHEDRFLMARLPKDHRLFGRRREPIEHWDAIEAAFYPSGLVEFQMACHGRTMDGYHKTERHHVGTFTARALLADEDPARQVASLLISLGVEERTDPVAQQLVWTVFYHLLLRPNDEQLRWLLPDDHWLVAQMDAIKGEMVAVRGKRKKGIRAWVDAIGRGDRLTPRSLERRVD
jgi:hypothetical protein